MDDSANEEAVGIYFSEFFRIDPEVVEAYGAFDVSLVADMPLFIDPFLLFTSTRDDYQELHRGIIKYLQFLLNRSTTGPLSADLVTAWFRFKEVKENWLGFSGRGNVGHGLGQRFADELHRNLTSVFRDFGAEKITRGSHLEKLCLISPRVGRDNISDFTVCLIKHFLLEYTQIFAVRFLDPAQIWTGAVERARFDYTTESWVSERYQLPKFGNSFVILSPKDLLRREETWINRPDLFRNFEQLAASMPDAVLRAQLNNYLTSQLVYPPKATDEERRKQRAIVFEEAIRKFPGIIEYYIRSKEDSGDEAQAISSEEVQAVFAWFVEQVREYVKTALAPSGFYTIPHDSYEAAMERLMFFKSFIEDGDGYRVFYHDGEPVQREIDLQLLFRLTWFATPFDVNAEVNNGRGPVDFKISFGSRDKSLVEFKLAKNPKLKSGLQKQLRIYEKANSTKKSIWAIFYFSGDQLKRVESILDELGLKDASNIVLIDCRSDNKPSASHARFNLAK